MSEPPASYPVSITQPAAPDGTARAGATVSRWFVRSAIGVLLAFYVVLSLSATRFKAQAYDEGEHIAIGYDMWLHRDFRMETANGDLVKRWATLPLLLSRPNFPPTTSAAWREGRPYRLAYEFMFQQGNNPRRILFQCRAMIAVLGVATALLVFALSRELFGPVGGLVSLTLFVLSPSMLAFGGIVSTEMTTCLTLLGAVWSSWRLLHRVTWSTFVTSIAFSALLVLSKPTAVIMFPLSALAIAVRLIAKRPLAWEIGLTRVIESRINQLAVIAGLAAIHIAAGWSVVWAAYDFRYAASPDPADPSIRVVTPVQDPIDPNILDFLHWSHDHRFLPEGYLRGIELLLGQNETQLAFMNGEWRFGGWPTFFPYSIVAKTHPALLLVFAASLVGWWRLRRRSVPVIAADAPPSPLYQATPYILLVVVYFAVAIGWEMNIGFRHILPIYPAAFVLAGALGVFWSVRWRLARWTLLALLGWVASGPVFIYPHFLAYFSPLVGGPAQGYKRLVDSSLDWGMDLPALRDWVKRNNADGHAALFLGYFGVSNPDYYGIKCFRLPGRPDWRPGKSFPLGPGIYAISATLLQGVGTRAPGPWNDVYERAWWRSLQAINRYDQTLQDPAAHAALLAQLPQKVWDDEYTRFDELRFARLCAWLRNRRPPDDQVGYSILIWRLTKEEVFEAGLGPPVELAHAPVRP